eukprot:gnl/Hemi2/7907_TR2731_c0_g1_i1.p1 gnl/Hemi2/7907_TR2731_c0_g1~~gnl/Hemi2/7907_TR2731_c0_g1_i1.p1  ORF type:complete len:255 (-),score=56.43 gnl/Hemi2/7907_TR2731_c0_g1_i1:95-829(-)
MTEVLTVNPHIAQAQSQLERWRATPSLAPAVTGTFECHIFCLPFNPDEATKLRFSSACAENGMKGLCLGLDYKDKGMVAVLQSSKYYSSTDPIETLKNMIDDSTKLAQHFEVVRIKIEAHAMNPGIPQTAEQSLVVPGDTYFEYHIKLVTGPVTPENDERLKVLSRELSPQLNIPTPFSCNDMITNGQRFINARTYRLGASESFALVSRIEEAIAAHGFQVEKVIREFIVYDTNKAVDKGWLEF